VTITSPASVNLIALPISSTWVSRRSSPRAPGRSADTSAFKASPLSAANASTAAHTIWTTLFSE